MDTGGAWNREYASKGRLWGGNPYSLPALAEGSVVLDLGCGEGRAIPGMIARGWSVTAFDLSVHALRIARATEWSHMAMFAIGNAEKLPFRDSAFDAVFAAHLVGHLMEPGRISLGRELVRVLSPKGRLFFRDFAESDFRSGRGMQVERCTWLRKNGIATHYFSEREVENLFSPLKPVALMTREWEIRIRGERLPRREIEAIFIKE